MTFVEIDTVDELKDGTMKMVIIDDHEYMLARVGGNYYCTDNRCPHMGGNLSMGKLEGTVVTCPRHHSQFDLTDGHNIRWTDWTGIKLAIGKLLRSPRPLRVYEVKVEGDKIMAEI
jgi:3-phenylpropionate/trans-cinnamate dioxygenase ferredoxin subunit